MARPEYDQFMFNELDNKSNDRTVLSDEVTSNTAFQEYKTLKQAALTADNSVSSLPNLILDGARSSSAPITADGGGRSHIDFAMKDGRQAHIEFNDKGEPTQAKLRDRDNKTTTDVTYADKQSGAKQSIAKLDASGNLSTYRYDSEGKLSLKEVAETNGTKERVEYDHGKLTKASAALADGSKVRQEFKDGAVRKIELEYKIGITDTYYKDAKTGMPTLVVPSYSKFQRDRFPQ
jgi:YD repeat-containing protein